MNEYKCADLPLLNQRKKRNKYFIYNVFDNKRKHGLVIPIRRVAPDHDKMETTDLSLHVYNIRIIFLGIYRDMYITQFRIISVFLFSFPFVDLFSSVP